MTSLVKISCVPLQSAMKHNEKIERDQQYENWNIRL
jgi:hypothetical protein